LLDGKDRTAKGTVLYLKDVDFIAFYQNNEET
jgi:hypothetical protein